jgi:hypothetical protein
MRGWRKSLKDWFLIRLRAQSILVIYVDLCYDFYFVKPITMFSLIVSGVLSQFDEGPTQTAYTRASAFRERCTKIYEHITGTRLWHQKSAVAQYFVDTKYGNECDKTSPNSHIFFKILS